MSYDGQDDMRRSYDEAIAAMREKVENPETFLDGRVTLYTGDCRYILPALPENSIDSVVCDPPYSLSSIVKRFGADDAAPAKSDGPTGVYQRASAGFMGKKWDTGETAFSPEFWAEVRRVLKPGGHLVAMGGTRTYHHLAMAIEQAGFEIRDQIAWAYGSGFPKSHNVSKGIDRAAGAERPEGELRINGRGAWNLKLDNHAHGDTGIGHADGSKKVYRETEPATEAAAQWEGWGTALKPAWEPCVLARKPFNGTVAANVLEHGTGALNIDKCRVGETGARNNGRNVDSDIYGKLGKFERIDYGKGRWPANIVHDGSDEVVACFPESADTHRETERSGSGLAYFRDGTAGQNTGQRSFLDDNSSAARFFYQAKADAEDRCGSRHPTVKPVDLMQWLCRLVTPPGGVVLDPFAGTGTTAEAAWREGFNAVLIEREDEYQNDIRRRMELANKGPEARKRALAKIKAADGPDNHGPLFDGGTKPDNAA